MPSDFANLQTAYSNICAAIADVTTNPKPNYSINGQSVNHSDHLANLIKQRESLKLAIRDEEGPFTILQQGV